METKLTRPQNPAVWQVPAPQSQALSSLANRSMRLDVTVQDGGIWIGDGTRSVEVSVRPLLKPAQ